MGGGITKTLNDPHQRSKLIHRHPTTVDPSAAEEAAEAA